MRISKLSIALCALLIGGCAEGFNVTRNAPSSIQLPNGTVVAAARGWCVDTSTSRARGDTAVVVLGSCAALASNALAPRPDVPGVVTVSVESEAGVSPSPKELETFFVSDAGRAALAHDGRAESVDILETRREDDLFILQAEDQSALPGASPVTWRALFDLEGRFVSVSLYGLSDRPIGRSEGLQTLEAQVDRLIAANDP